MTSRYYSSLHMLCFSSTVSYNPAFESLTSKSAYVTPVREDKLTPDPICPTLTVLKYTERPITVKKKNHQQELQNVSSIQFIIHNQTIIGFNRQFPYCRASRK